MKKLLACLLMLVMALTAVTATAEGLTFSWWGGDARHAATQEAVAAFTAATGIEVTNTYSAWSGWEDKMSQYFASDSAFDVNQVNWNWLFSFTNADGSSKFYDINEVADVIDLTQFDEGALAQCTVDGKLLAIPVSMTGRIFYWNKTTFEKVGLETPKTLSDLMAAGPIFAEKLGDECYPLALGSYDKMILMVHYLECKYGKDWVVDGKLNYTKDEIIEGFAFIQSLEDAHVIPSSETLTGDGADSLDKNPKWMEGKYAGIWEWDSSASKFEKALNEGQEFIVGDYFTDLGEYQGCALKRRKEKKIVTVGRVIGLKRPLMILDAFRNLSEEFPEHRLAFYGEGDMREEVLRAAEAYGLRERVELPGAVTDVFERISTAELFVMASDYEGMSNALLEAMCMGLPVVSTKVSGAVDVIRDGENGLLVDCGSEKGLTDAMRRMLRDEALREGCARKAAELAGELEIGRITDEWMACVEKTRRKKGM